VGGIVVDNAVFRLSISSSVFTVAARSNLGGISRVSREPESQPSCVPVFCLADAIVLGGFLGLQR